MRAQGRLRSWKAGEMRRRGRGDSQSVPGRAGRTAVRGGAAQWLLTLGEQAGIDSRSQWSSMKNMSDTNTKSQLLCRFPQGSVVRVEELVPCRGARARLYALGLTPGTELEVISSSGGPCRLRVRGSDLVLGHGLANKIIVCPVEAHPGTACVSDTDSSLPEGCELDACGADSCPPRPCREACIIEDELP